MIRLPMTGQMVAPDPVESRHFVTKLCECVGVPPQEVFSAEQVTRLLDLADYSITPNTLQEFQRKGYVGEVTEWDATAIHCLAAAMDHRRRWKNPPCHLHDVFKSSARLMIERGLSEGYEPFPDSENFTLEDLLIALTATDNRAIREGLFEAVKHKMNLLGFVEE